MKTTRPARRSAVTIALCALALPTACAQTNKPASKGAQPAPTQDEQGSKKTMSPQDLEKTATPKTAEIVLPKPKIDYPELPYDKKQLPGIAKLEGMMLDAATLDACVALIDTHFQAMKRGADTSLNGDAAEQIKGLLAIVDSIEGFEREALPVAKLARKNFMAKHASDDEFSSRYREGYSAAEEELESIIGDHAARRAVVSAMSHGYRGTPRTQLSYLESMLEDASRVRSAAIDKVVRSTETDLMVADYKKGRTLAELLQSSRNKLALVLPLDPKSAKIASMLETIDSKQKSRSAEIAEARASYEFPARYDATNAPKNAEELEASMKAALKKAGYKVERIVIASAWIAVRSPLGIHLYNQIDFHVAARSRVPEEAAAGVLDVLYVTGKTAGTELAVPFARRSVGSVAQMLATSL